MVASAVSDSFMYIYIHSQIHPVYEKKERERDRDRNKGRKMGGGWGMKLRDTYFKELAHMIGGIANLNSVKQTGRLEIQGKVIV